MTSHCITWHDNNTSHRIASNDVTITWPDPATDIKRSKHFTSKHKTSPPRNGRRLVHSKEMIWASRWSSPCAHSIGKFFLCYIVLFLLETSAPGLSGHYWYKDYAFLNAPFHEVSRRNFGGWNGQRIQIRLSLQMMQFWLPVSTNFFFPIRFHFFSNETAENCRWTVKHSGFKKIEIQTLSVQRGLASLWRWENMALNGSRFGLMATSSKNLLHPRRQTWKWTESSPWCKYDFNYASLMKDFCNSKLVA